MPSSLPPMGGVGDGRKSSSSANSPNTPPMNRRGHVTLAVIIGAHGVTGEVKLKLFGEGADSLKRYRTLNVGDKALTIKQIRPANHGAIARFVEVTDRNAADALRGTEITVTRDALPPLEEGEYYHTDLIGLPCETPEGTSLGTIVAVENFGAGDIIEIEKPAEEGKKPKRFMVPMRTEAVLEWNSARAIVSPDWVE